MAARYAKKPTRGGASAAPTTTPVAKAGESTTRRSNGCGGRKGCGCRNTDVGNGSAPPPHPTPRRLTRRTEVWAVDFQFDSTTDGRPIKIVSIVDEHTREGLGGLVERSITGDRLIDELDRLADERGYPTVVRCDNGPELACTAMADWADERVGLGFIPPGEPWRNGYIEYFNGRLSEPCSNANRQRCATHCDDRHLRTARADQIRIGCAAAGPRFAALHPVVLGRGRERRPARSTRSRG